MQQLLQAIPKMMEEVLKKVEQEGLNTSKEREKETKKLLANLRKITTQMKDIANAQGGFKNKDVFSMLNNIENLQALIPQVNEEQLFKLKEMSPELGDLMNLKDSLRDIPSTGEVMKVLSPTEKVKQKSLKEGQEVEKSTETQPKTDRVNPTKEED